jgi:4a-hydroxytetrahydrobiopterin dehydratase
MAPELLLSRTAASTAVEGMGWRHLLGVLQLAVPVSGLAVAVRLAAVVVDAAGPDVDAHLRLDLRPDALHLTVQTRAVGGVTAVDAALARAVTAALAGAGAAPYEPSRARPVQALELAVDALDIPAVRPFWAAVLGYVDDPAGRGDPTGALVDPAGVLPAVWFQQMDVPRPQRNRLHVDLTVAHDEADARVHSALAAGGRLVDDSEARAFWVLADAEGNEVCVCTWQDRDAPSVVGQSPRPPAA